ncbi:GspE/PulE family protein [Helicobacter mustelae]|uniref:Putative type II protein secretion system E protein n=1 Tax=Helicobacter mustelae (strain ATCC 43772 / CCUG 25715 / CIP 103759 / LMG 18044 / NCTC 12198 / R85-136P) TaxID=679897 RepID=D3UJK8_HELM1|nr:ATPase, T2SS/T4P/T4SS family [Helicobacter mustelae]CBG40684.1 putative type II protein secretion system E protein [Helicobacter mustelae 12198]SQH72181.1 type II protein secretion system E protein [Helicobacter mustelae]
MRYFSHPQNLKIFGKHFCQKYQALLLLDSDFTPCIASKNPLPIPLLQEICKPYFEEIPKILPLSRAEFFQFSKYFDFQEKQAHIKNNIGGLFSLILQEAVLLETSDIHLESFHIKDLGIGGVLRFRVHGDLEIVSYFEEEVFRALCSKIKLDSRLNITDIKQAQDGRYATRIQEREYDCRVSAIPLYNGESLVLRILYKNKNNRSLESLHFTPSHLKILQQTLKIPYGILLVVGATGSGKSTTLYAILQSLQNEHKKIITLEDPPEHQMPFATQVKISSEFDFQEALRAILRHDPDIIVVGEIRDQITLELAFGAALTGHLVLATLHSNDCQSALQRLQNMGMAKQDILASLLLILAQRLYKSPCQHCQGGGCEHCNMQGIFGREVVTEILAFDSMVKKAVLQDCLQEYLEQSGFESLEQNLMRKIAEGRIVHKE